MTLITQTTLVGPTESNDPNNPREQFNHNNPARNPKIMLQKVQRSEEVLLINELSYLLQLPTKLVTAITTPIKPETNSNSLPLLQPQLNQKQIEVLLLNCTGFKTGSSIVSAGAT